MENKQEGKNIEDILNSLNNINRASPAPFLLTRIQARMNNQTSPVNLWSKLASFISKPSVAMAAIVIVLLLNITAIAVRKQHGQKSSVTQSFSERDEFAITSVNMYDPEIAEP